MMTMKEADALPIPERYKNTPNLYRLARIINSTDCPDKIMATLPLVLSGMDFNRRTQEGGAEA